MCENYIFVWKTECGHSLGCNKNQGFKGNSFVHSSHKDAMYHDKVDVHEDDWLHFF
jgi:hypothetical protein